MRPLWESVIVFLVKTEPPIEGFAGIQGRQRMEKAKEPTSEVKEATTRVVDKLRPKAGWVSLRETLCREGFDDERGLRRIAALWGAINAPFCR
jgi:hypothetical protein